MIKLHDEIGDFTTVPETVIKMIPQIGAEAFSLFCYLRYRRNGKTGKAFPSYETIREDTGLNFRKIARSLRTLEATLLMRRTKRFGNSSEYTLTCPSPNNGGSQVLTTGVGKSLQRVQTNKIDGTKIDENKISTGTAAEKSTAVESPAPKPNIFTLYENNIGLLTPIMADELRAAEQEFPAEWVADAFKEAIKANVRRWSYIRAILDRWKVEGRTGAKPTRGNGHGPPVKESPIDMINRIIREQTNGDGAGSPKTIDISPRVSESESGL